jgi:hypothetical protein
VPPVKLAKATTKLEAPTIQVRIERYRAQKLAAAAAHVPTSGCGFNLSIASR